MAAATPAERALQGPTVAPMTDRTHALNADCPLVQARPTRHDLDHRRTLDRSDERDAAARQGPLLVWHARVAIGGRLAQRGRHPHRAAGAPLPHRAGRQGAADRQPDAAARWARRRPIDGRPSPADKVRWRDIDGERDTRRGQRRVFAQDGRAVTAVASTRMTRLEPHEERRPIGADRRVGPERQADDEGASDHARGALSSPIVDPTRARSRFRAARGTLPPRRRAANSAGARSPTQEPATHIRRSAGSRGGQQARASSALMQEMDSAIYARFWPGTARGAQKLRAGYALSVAVSAWYSCSARTVRPSVCHRPDRVDRGRGAGQRGDAGHAVHHRDAAHGAVVEERLAAERRVDDQLHVVVEDLVADVRAAFVDLEDDLGIEAMRAEEVGGAARRDQLKPAALRSRAIGTTPGLS